MEVRRVKKNIVSNSAGMGKGGLMKVKKCMCGDCEDCFKDFTYFLHIFSNDQSVPDITAKSWCIWRRSTIAGK